ncbi:MAG TPA: hypothetical protein VFU15_09745 [Bacteroidia bacterium]|nr:hypothetical protein [Bacteroidia bacterium]
MRSIFPFAATAFLLLTVSLFSCTGSNATAALPDRNTRIFDAYLSINFSDSIPSSGRNYLCVTRKTPAREITEQLRTVKKLLRKGKLENWHVIVSSDALVPDSLLPAIPITTDWDGAIDRLDIFQCGLSVVKTSGGKIDQIIPLFPQEEITEKDLE